MANTSLHIKRIQQELKDFQNNPSDTFHAEPLKEDLHVWHFTIKGPPDTEFEGGIYHGKIELPFDYPLKPPALYFLTQSKPSGRYETNTKICLTITDYHPEHWNPGWTIKTMLKALISYFPEKEKVLGVGGLDYPAEERKRLALLSRKWECPACGPIKDIIQEKNEEEKKAEEELEKAREIKRQEDEEVSVELALAAGQEKEQLERVEEIVEKPKQEDDEWEDEKEEEEKEQRIPEKKESNKKEIIKEEKKRESVVGIEEVLKEKMNKKTIEVGLENLQSIMMQHIMYYETKRTVKYEKNVLNVEKPKEEQNLKAAREEAQRKRREEEKQRERGETAIDNLEDYVREEEVEAGEEVNAEEEAEVVKRTAEKEQIKKQLNIINLLIIALLLGAVAVGVFM